METVEVIVFYVGFGDCIHITFADDTQVLVDTGHAKHYKDIKKKLEEKNKHIDYLLLTHSHADHINGTVKFLNDPVRSIKPKGIIWWLNPQGSPSPTNIKVFSKVKKYISQEKMATYCIKMAEDELEFFKKYVDVLYPFSENTNFSTNQNRNSIVFTVNIGTKRLLFMGDATIEEEKEILNRYKSKADNIIFMKIGHHGSDTSTSESF